MQAFVPTIRSPARTFLFLDRLELIETTLVMAADQFGRPVIVCVVFSLCVERLIHCSLHRLNLFCFAHLLLLLYIRVLVWIYRPRASHILSVLRLTLFIFLRFILEQSCQLVV
jgi:hypothetical protein